MANLAERRPLDPDTRGELVRVILWGGASHPARRDALEALAADPGCSLRRQAAAALKLEASHGGVA